MYSFIVNLAENIVYYCLLWVYFPLYVVGLILIRIKLFINRLKLATRFGMVYVGIMLPLSKRSKVFDVGRISTEEEIDFLMHRSIAYVNRTTLWTAKELAKLAVRRQKIELISDSQLCFVLYNTVFAHSLVWDEERKMHYIDLSPMNKLTLFQGFYWEAKCVFVDPEKNKIIIQMEGGEELHSDCSLHDKPDYELAKLHLQVCMSFYAPGLSHNYVHFVFPSSICLNSKKFLSKDGVLYKLLSPHFRFMERLNYQALRVCHASSNTRTIVDRLVCFWKTFPITKEQFSGTMEKKLHQHYFNEGMNVCEKPVEEQLLSNSLQKGSKPVDRDHPLFPPAYVTDLSLQQIPYLDFLRQYYAVIREFVQDMEPHIDRNEWEQLSHEVAVHVPNFDNVNMVDAITSFIHLVSIVHSTDHKSYVDYFAQSYGCMCIRTPYESFKNTSFWQGCTSDFDLPVEYIQKDPTELICQQDVMRMRCFLNVFVDYIPDSSFDLKLLSTKYNFSNFKAEAAVRNFKSNLRSLDGNLTTQKSPISIKEGRHDTRPSGMQIVKAGSFIRSNCY